MENLHKSPLKLIFLAMFVFLIIGIWLYTDTSKVNVNDTGTSEISFRGIVIRNELEDLEIGGYLQIKLQNTNEDIFVLYNPSVYNKRTSTCLNKIDTTGIYSGVLVEVRGQYIKEIGGVQPKSVMVSTCESSEYYVKKIVE